MKLLRDTKSKITKYENSENAPYLNICEVVLAHFYIFNHYYQQNSRVFYKLVPDKFFGQLLDISSTNFIIFKAFDSDFSYIEV